MSFMVYLEKSGSHYDNNGNIVDNSKDKYNECAGYRGLFNFIYNSKYAVSRFGYFVSTSKTKGDFFFNLPAPSTSGTWYNSFGDAGNQGWVRSKVNRWNQTVSKAFDLGETVYLTMVFDGIGGMESLYVNGENVESVLIDKSYWDGFMEDSILLGAGNMTMANWWHLTKMDCYAIRLYSRALTSTEVSENYLSTVSYHDFLEGANN